MNFATAGRINYFKGAVSLLEREGLSTEDRNQINYGRLSQRLAQKRGNYYDSETCKRDCVFFRECTFQLSDGVDEPTTSARRSLPIYREQYGRKKPQTATTAMMAKPVQNVSTIAIRTALSPSASRIFSQGIGRYTACRLRAYYPKNHRARGGVGQP